MSWDQRLILTITTDTYTDSPATNLLDNRSHFEKPMKYMKFPAREENEWAIMFIPPRPKTTKILMTLTGQNCPFTGRNLSQPLAQSYQWSQTGWQTGWSSWWSESCQTSGQTAARPGGRWGWTPTGPDPESRELHPESAGTSTPLARSQLEGQKEGSVAHQAQSVQDLQQQNVYTTHEDVDPSKLAVATMVELNQLCNEHRVEIINPAEVVLGCLCAKNRLLLHLQSEWKDFSLGLAFNFFILQTYCNVSRQYG